MVHHASIHKNKQVDFLTNIFMQVAFLIHIFWAVLFFWLDIPVLGYVNLASSLIYIGGFFINKRGYTLTALYIGHIEIVIHATIAVNLLGSGAGFQYYIVHAIILTFIALKPSILVKSFIVLIDTVILVALALLFKAPSVQVDAGVLDGLLVMNIIFVCFTLAFLTFLFRKVTDTAENNLMELNKKLEVYANTDTLTNLLNRRSMMKKMKEAEEQFDSHQKPFTVIIADIDNFKLLNDTYGHDCGDMVLKESAAFLEDYFSHQPVARWGGEEFLILLHDTGIDKARQKVEELKRSLEEDISFNYQGKSLKISLTYGLTEHNDSKVDVLDCINHADKALMKGKNQGKNCVVVA